MFYKMKKKKTITKLDRYVKLYNQHRRQRFITNPYSPSITNHNEIINIISNDSIEIEELIANTSWGSKSQSICIVIHFECIKKIIITLHKLLNEIDF